MEQIDRLKENIDKAYYELHDARENIESLNAAVRKELSSAYLKMAMFDDQIKEREGELKLLEMAIKNISTSKGEAFSIICDGKQYSIKPEGTTHE